MNRLKIRKRLAILASASLSLMLMIGGTAGDANAGAVIVNGGIALGVNDEGHLNILDPTGAVVTSNTGSGEVGVATKFPDGSWRDATAPGCLCEGWGVSANGVSSGYANVSIDGVVNLTLDSFTSTATTATSSVHLTSLPGLTVTQAYAPSAAPTALFEDKVTITNSTGGTLTDVKYVRVMDWDIPPTEFSEYVTIKGTGSTTLLEESHDNGFNTANPLGFSIPLDPTTLNVDFTDNGIADHGAYFRFNFGSLANGDSYTFKIYYGAATSEAAALAALGTVGTELYSLGQNNLDPTGGTPATYMFGFSGVGGTPIVSTPEPASILLMGSGLLGLFAMRRRFKK